MSTRTVLDVVQLSTTYLAEHGSDSARLDAELLCAHALGLRRLDLYLQHDRPLTDEELAVIREAVRRRGLHEPVAYITGEREFYGRSFSVDRNVLVPRPETETLIERCIALLRGRASSSSGVVRVADLGTGSGCIAVTVACEVPGAEIVATDASEAALGVARRNAARHRVDERIRFAIGEWGAPLDGVFDAVLSNPPYVTTSELDAAPADVRDYEPRQALVAGEDGLLAYRALLQSLHAHVRRGSVLLLEVDPRRAGAVSGLVTEAFAEAKATIHPDLAGRDRVVEADL